MDEPIVKISTSKKLQITLGKKDKETERLRKAGNEMLSDIQSNTISATNFKRIAQLDKWKQALKEE